MDSEESRKVRDCEALKQIIGQWNANRLDLFSLSEPNQDLEFHGVMRFYFQDSGQKIATKCVRVSSTASTQAVVETLIEKFRPDMKMLYVPEYALYEIHPNGEERRLSPDEKPLLVQLNWHKDDREGRFLLRRVDEKSTLPALQPPEESSFRRKLSKREKRQVKKQERLRRMRSGSGTHDENDVSVAEKLYTELPETSFTRSISNPEAVMRRRRQQKLEKKLQAFRSKDGGPDTGGTLKIYGESLCKDVPYKTLLLSVRDNAAFVVREMLDKYGLLREDPQNYCLVQVMASNGSESPDKFSGEREYILDDDECPLSILMNHPPSQGPLMFHVRRRPAEHASRRRKKKPGTGAGSGASSRNGLENESVMDSADRLPYLLELNLDGSEVRQNQAQRHVLQPNVTEVGSERSLQGQSLTLFGTEIQARHCVIAHTEGIITLTPCSRQADTYVNGQRIYETTILHHGSVVRFGQAHNFRFVDPNQEERVRTRYDSGNSSNRPTDLAAERWRRMSTQTNEPLDRARRRPKPKPRPNSEYNPRSANYDRYPTRGTDPILPAVLELPEETEDGFLHALVPGLDTRGTQFKLAPTYAIYLAARHRASTHFRPELTPLERAHRLTLLLGRVGAMIQAVVQERYSDPGSLAFWMANASELLHFLKCDRHICAFSLDGQDLLAEAVEQAFRSLTNALQAELLQATPAMVSEKEDGPDDEAATAPVLSVLTSCMGLLRRCRLNAALTIQLFSQLFHSLNAHIFNRLLGVERVGGGHLGMGGAGSVNMCSRAWGARLGRRLHRLELWAERQGLELAADCHLARLVQATHLLQAPKGNGDELSSVVSACFKLNSLQLRALLERYRSATDEPSIPQHLIDAVVRVAENTADELALADGREIRLEEDTYLAVPFLLPDDGYSCDVMRGLPPGLTETLAPLQHAGLCRLTPQPTSSGFWTIYMGEAALSPQPQMRSPSAMSGRAPPSEPEVKVLQLRKTSESMGLSIVAARGTGQDRLGIYIKSVVKGGSADLDGRLQAGDQLLSVDGQSLIGITQDKAAEIMMRTGPVVCLEVAKQGAMFHGLATLLQQPSPTSSRASLPKSRPKSEDVSSLTSPPMESERRGYQERLVDWDRPPKGNTSQISPPHPSTLEEANASFSNPNLNADHPGYHGYGPRRMSERDVLPLNRMQNSKSVPALNSEMPSASMPMGDRVSPGGSAGSGSATLGPPQQRALSSQYLAPAQQSRPMVPNTQNPHYDPAAAQPPHHGLQSFGSQPTLPVVSSVAHARSRSVQNLAEGRGGSLRGRNPSGHEEDRQYQNVTMYQTSQPDAGQYLDDKIIRQPRMLQPLYQTQTTSMAAPMQVRTSSLQQMPTRGPMPAGYNPHHQQQQQQQQPIRSSGPGQTHQSYSPRQPHSGNAPFNPQDKQFNRHLMSGTETITAESPPPPPPPTSTHPLYNARSVTSMSSQAEFRQSRDLLRAVPVQLSATNPWDREEKEMEQKRRKEAVRQWMDEQIAELEGMPNRGQRQEEQLRTLRLEREFQRRAQEMASRGEDEEENEEEEEGADRREMMRLVQEDVERARKWRMEREKQALIKVPNVVPPSQPQPVQYIQNQQAHTRTTANGTSNVSMTPSYITQPKPLMNANPNVQHDEDRQRKIDAFHQKQRELEATQQAEERILREAQRRKEEEVRASQQNNFQYSSGPNQRLDSLLVKRESAPPQGDYIGQHTYQAPPLPPTGPVHVPAPHPPPTSKRVSFHDQPNTQMGRIVSYDANANQEKVFEDPDIFINEAEHLLSTPKNDTVLLTGSTPGVIGAQEVYKDPRLRRLAEQEQQQKSSNRAAGPEKMSFKEKMKMFALESGEANSPKDKVTISRAQREIDSRGQLINVETEEDVE